MVRASHGAKHELLLINLYRSVHRILIVRIVARFFIEIELGDVRSADVLVATTYFFIDNKALKLAPNSGALWKPEGEPFADNLGESKELQLSP
jgi:hypothetical protein